jgi:hypothetical protein
LIIGGTTDYLSAEAADPTTPPGYNGYKDGNPVVNGALKMDQFTTPYTISQTATFVATGGTPAYYLSITQSIFNVHPYESFVFEVGEALYVPPSFTNFIADPPGCVYSVRHNTGTQCAIGRQVTKLTGGLYTSSDHSFGIAMSMRPNWSQSTIAWVNFDGVYPPPAENQNAGLNSNYWVFPPMTTQTVQFYVMVGSWTNALNFANSH